MLTLELSQATPSVSVRDHRRGAVAVATTPAAPSIVPARPAVPIPTQRPIPIQPRGGCFPYVQHPFYPMSAMSTSHPQYPVLPQCSVPQLAQMAQSTAPANPTPAAPINTAPPVPVEPRAYNVAPGVIATGLMQRYMTPFYPQYVTHPLYPWAAGPQGIKMALASQLPVNAGTATQPHLQTASPEVRAPGAAYIKSTPSPIPASAQPIRVPLPMQGRVPLVQQRQLTGADAYTTTADSFAAQMSRATGQLVNDKPAIVSQGAITATSMPPSRITLPDIAGQAVRSVLQQNEMMRAVAAAQQGLYARNVWQAQAATRNVAAAYVPGPVAAINRRLK